jgi:hypothetical protein
MAARQSMRVLREAAARVEARLAELPDDQVALLKLQREIELLERFYLALKEKQQEYEITERAKAPASRLVAHAIAPVEPARPKKLLTIAAGLVAGVLLGLLAVGLAEQLDDRVHEPRKAAELLGAPVVAVLGRGWEADDTRSERVLRSVRRHLRAVAGGGAHSVVLASSGEGETARAVADGLQRAAGEGREQDGLTLEVAPAEGGLAAMAELLAAGSPVLLVIDLQDRRERVRGLGDLGREHATGPLTAVVTGAGRSSTDYLTPGTRT